MKIVFICHEASRTGVPLLLLQLIRWLKAEHGIKVMVVLLKGGSLEGEFRKAATVFVWNRNISRIHGSFVIRVFSRLRNLGYRLIRKYVLWSLLKNFGASIVYLNTAAALPFFCRHQVLFRNLKWVLHCHEMPYTIAKFVRDSTSSTLSRMDRIFVVNQIIHNYFATRGIASARLVKVTEYQNKVEPSSTAHKQSNEFRIINVGLGSWRKGIDLFILTAFYFSRIYKERFVFNWVGFINPSLAAQVQYDLKLLGLTDNLRFIGELSDPSEYLNACDVLFITSREDPYPVVMLEAASFGKPITYFRNTGGVDEFVADGEMSIEPFDVSAAAEKLKFLAENPKIRIDKGVILKERARSHTVEHVGQIILRELKKI